MLKRSDSLIADFMEEMSYLSADMFMWLDETGSDNRYECRKFGYHLCGITPTSYKLAIRGQQMSCIAAMSTRGNVEDVESFFVHKATHLQSCFLLTSRCFCLIHIILD